MEMGRWRTKTKYLVSRGRNDNDHSTNHDDRTLRYERMTECFDDIFFLKNRYSILFFATGGST